jgi:hypothetical protein
VLVPEELGPGRDGIEALRRHGGCLGQVHAALLAALAVVELQRLDRCLLD